MKTAARNGKVAARSADLGKRSEIRTRVFSGNGFRTHLPTIITSSSEARRRMWVHTSMAKIVADELKMDVRDDISADIITASIIPRAPA